MQAPNRIWYASIIIVVFIIREIGACIARLHPGTDEAQGVRHQLGGGGGQHAGAHQQHGGRRQPMCSGDLIAQDAKRGNVDS